jgi:hypothetical protein
MRKKNIFLSFFVLVVCFIGNISAQTPTASPAERRLSFYRATLRQSAARKSFCRQKMVRLMLSLSDKTEFKRVSPDNPSLKTAVAVTLAEFGVGDKLIVTGNVSADKKSIPAKAVYLMRQSDIAQKQNKEREEWRTRGITGQVVAVNRRQKKLPFRSAESQAKNKH